MRQLRLYPVVEGRQGKEKAVSNQKVSIRYPGKLMSGRVKRKSGT